MPKRKQRRVESPSPRSLPEYSLVLAERAQDDFEDIILYTEQTWGEKQADEYASVIRRALQSLKQNPRMGHSRSELRPGYRCFHAGRHLILYRIEASIVYVVSILHERMDVRIHLDEPSGFFDL